MLSISAPFINVVFRIATLATRFVLVFILAKFLDPADVGLYGLFTATVGYALLCVGLDLYVYTTRELLRAPSDRAGRFLKSQASIVGICYVILSPAVLFVFPLLGLPSWLILWFIPVLVLEHLNQEIYRLLIALSHQLSASLLLFVRQGSWALALTFLFALNETSRSLNAVMFLWSSAGAVAACAGVWKVKSLKLGGWKSKVDWAWIKRGLSVSGGFLVATLGIRAVQTFDRYWLENLAGLNVVGAYVLFFGVASALNVFLDAAIFSFRYPELIDLGNRKAYSEMRRIVRRMWLQATGSAIVFAVLSSLMLPILLNWIGKPVYLSAIDLYYWVLVASIFFSLSMIPHYALYALGHDRTIILGHLMALLFFGVTTTGFAAVSATYAVPIGVLVAMVAVLIWKSWAYFRAFRSEQSQGVLPILRSNLTK